MGWEHSTAGERVLGRLDEDPGTQHIPVISGSAHRSMFQQIPAFREQGYGFVEQPGAIDDLLGQIAAALPAPHLRKHA